MKIVLLIALLQAPAQQQLTITEAVQTALSAHPLLVAAQAHAERSEHATSEVRATRLPQLTLESAVTRYQEPMVVAPLHGFDPMSPPVFDRTLAQGALTLNYTLLDAGRGDRIRGANAIAAAADAGVDATRALIISETVRAYLRVRSARELADAHSRQVRALTEERDRAQQLVTQGRAARVVLLRAEAALSAARAEEVAAQSELAVAHQELARLLARTEQAVRAAEVTAVRVRESADTVRAMQLAAAQRANPELRRLRLRRDAVRAERDAARGYWWPRVQAVGRYVEYGSTETSPQGEWQAGAQLSYPIFTGGARGAAIDRASADLRAAEAEIAQGERSVSEALDRARSALAAAQARVMALTAAVSQSLEVTRIERLALDAGAGVQSDYLTAEANRFRARASLTDARAPEVLAQVELARVTGTLTVDWVAANLENVP